MNLMFDDILWTELKGGAPSNRVRCPRNPRRFPIKRHRFLAAAGGSGGEITNNLELISTWDCSAPSLSPSSDPRTKQWQVQALASRHIDDVEATLVHRSCNAHGATYGVEATLRVERHKTATYVAY